MGFAAPLFLFGLIALLIPFLLLFTKASATRTTQFSSVEFLRAITEHASRVMEWKRLLLLAVRVLFLGLLAMAFALPFTSRTCRLSLFAAGPAKRVAIFMDTSLGMSYREKDEKSLFENARLQAEEVVHKNSGTGATFSIYGFNRKVQILAQEERDASRVLQKLRDIKVTEAASDFGVLAQFLDKQFGRRPDLPEEIWVFSDFSIREASDAALLEKFRENSDSLRAVNWVTVRPKEFQNFWIRDIALPPRPFLKQVKEKIPVLYQSQGLKTGAEVKLDLWVEGTKSASKTVKVDESGKGMVIFEQAFPSAGHSPVRVESSADNLDGDNSRSTVVTVSQPLELLVVEDGVYDYPFQNPYYYVSQALESFAGVSAHESWVDMARIPAAGLKDVRLSDYNVILVADVPGLAVRDLSQLRSYLKDGGAVIFAAGKNFAEKKGDDALAKFLGGTLGAPENVAGEDGSFYLKGIDYRHPILDVFDGGRQGDLTRVPFRMLMPFTPAEGEKNVDVVLWFESKWPALVEKKVGAGKLFIWTTSLNQEWTPFPKDPLYVPFVFELLKYAAFGVWKNSAGLEPGEKLSFDSAAGREPFDQVMLRTPQGEQITLFGHDGVSPPPALVETAGIYEWVGVRGESMERRMSASNVNLSESSPAYVTLQGSAEDSGQQKTLNPAMGPASAQRRFFYRALFYAMLFLLLAEAWLANRFYKPEWV